jgi:hypothetical protein
MVDDSAVTNVIKDLLDGMFDVLLDGVTVEAYVPVYLSGDAKVKPVTVDVTQANIKKLLGWSRAQAITGEDTQVAVKTRFRTHQKGTAGGTVAAGDPVKHESGAGAKVNYYKKFVEDTDGEQEYIGMCLIGGADEAAIEVLLF